MCLNIEKLYKTWDKRYCEFLKQYQGVIIACSGGIDSTALFYLLWNFLKNNKNYFLGLAHVNFKLRNKESDDDQKFIENLSTKYCIDLKLLVVTEQHNKLKKGLSTQEWARLIRYQFFYKIAQQGYIIALGHNLDDLAENVLIRLSRGSQITRAAGMKEWSPPFWRPLLSVSRKQIQEYVKTNNIQYREDSSNLKLDYTRNIIRHNVLNVLETTFPKAKKKISLAAQDYLELYEFLKTHIKHNYIINNKIKIDLIKHLSPIVIGEILNILFENYKIPPTKISRNLLLDIAYKIQTSDNKSLWEYSLPNNKVLKVNDGFAQIESCEYKQKNIRFNQHKKNLFKKDILVLLNKESKGIVQIDGEKYICDPILFINKEKFLGDNNMLFFNYEKHIFEKYNLTP